jgi:co-chaperonin GroES (HSP10)
MNSVPRELITGTKHPSSLFAKYSRTELKEDGTEYRVLEASAVLARVLN